VNHPLIVPLLGFAAAAVAYAALAEAQESDQGVTAAPPQAQPQNPVEPIEEIVVFGRSLTLLGTAAAASEGTVVGADLLVRPMLRVAELLESVPGLIAAQHSGSGKANQYFLRGFNLDHGTDFTTSIDGVPLNLRSHGHGQGYLDINGLMPETVERIDYRKGTYRADVGDFSMAGSSFITTINEFDTPFMSYESGEYGWDRVAAGGSRATGEGTLTGVAEWKAYDGPWALAEELQHVAAWGKYSRGTGFGRLAATVSAYDADWRPTEQIPERAIGTAVCPDPFCALGDTARGHTSRWIGSAEITGAQWNASAYLQYYDWRMQSDPTYDFQIDQFDHRWTTGGRYERWLIDKADLTVNIGTELRYDDIGDVGVDHDSAGVFVENVSRNSIKETSIGVFSEASWSLTDSLRVVGGLRGDFYDFNVTAKSPGSYAGSQTDGQISPKVGVAYTLNRDVEVYGNWGRGFHSNDARGVVNSAIAIPGLSPGTGYEVGARFEIGALKLTSAYWWLDLDSELIFVGDSNSVEPRGASQRDGYELTFFWRPIDWLGIDAVYTGSNARYVDNPDGPYIEGSVEHAGELGVQAVKDRWEGSMRVRYLGPYALTPDNANRASPETTISLRGAYRFRRTMLYAELFNITDAAGKDIVYWYEAYVPGLDPPGTSSADVDCSVTNCRVSRAQEPRTLRVGLKVSF
jgi:outer membrane receptor protein involved in Fe transport